MALVAPFWEKPRMKVGLALLAAVGLAACTPYAQYALAPHPQSAIPDPVGLIVAEGIAPAPPTFPGLLTLVGLGVAAGATAVDAVLVGPVPYRVCGRLTLLT